MGFDKGYKPSESEQHPAGKAKKISRRDFLKSLGLSAGAFVLSSCGVKPTTEDDTLSSQVEEEQNPEIERLLNGLISVYGVFSTTDIPARLHIERQVESRIYKDDSILRTNFERRLSELDDNETGKDLIVQSLGYPHIVHNNTYLLAKGYDVYNNFNPNQTGHESDARILEVMKHDIEEVEQSKTMLQAEGIDKLKGFAINYDEHSSDFLSSDAVDKTFPSIDTLKEQGITRLIFVGEFSPRVEQGIAEQITDNSYAPRDHLIDFVQRCQKSEIEVIVWGIDTRHDVNDDAKTIDTTTEQSCDVDYVKLENESTVIFGDCAPDSNPRVKLSDGTLMRVLGGEVQIIPPENPLGRDATQEEVDSYYQLVEEAQSQR